ncbi:FAD-binding protein [Nocardia sp. NPDC056952]|uniref:FAD-binding protein n=1 Tax=Nocardia sp. NPDC056952 TaxID=3345979 RepID=UPI0036393ACD
MAVTNPGHADVVVVGGGIAGACTAISAAETGADVVLLERSSGIGGTSALAAGHFYLGGGTPVQLASGFEDTVEAMFDYLMAVTAEPDAAKIRAYCDDSVAHFHWLEAHGVEFERSFYPGKAVVQPGTEGLMWTGNEKVWPYRDQAEPAPRGHKIAAPAEQGGSQVMRVMAAALERAGVRVQCASQVTELRTDDAGTVVGVGCRDESLVRANSVVLATGGYVMNPEMLRTYTPVLAEKAVPLGTPTDDGSGILLGQSVGGALAHMHGAFMTASFYPPADLLKGIVVNAEGGRFVAEDSYHGRTAAAVLRESRSYLIVDAAIMAWPELPMIEFIDGWETIAEMEAALGIPEGKLAATLRDYNEAAACGTDPVLHKHPDWLVPVDTGPWAAFHLTPPEATYVGFTLGGLRTTVDGQVCRADGGVIAGLYAVGACASTIVQDGAGYSSGTCLGESSYFGRRAGMHAAGARA